MESLNEQIVLQLVLTVGSLVGIFVWAFKKLINYFTQKLDKKDNYLTELVKTNQSNVTSFVETINHQRTKDREALAKLTSSIDESNKVNTALISFLKHNGYGKDY